MVCRSKALLFLLFVVLLLGRANLKLHIFFRNNQGSLGQWSEVSGRPHHKKLSSLAALLTFRLDTALSLLQLLLKVKVCGVIN